MLTGSARASWLGDGASVIGQGSSAEGSSLTASDLARDGAVVNRRQPAAMRGAHGRGTGSYSPRKVWLG